ncbi:single-stranded DNA-binding protein [Lacihabitans sp. LS3-19]|uniref:single-stranded DNA-binding protein n=1 Tax=Lacihabitans sp. LS3-19 TaxID=2487335 RepID=UPI0020CF4C82|nr:single-stranded DNA-binding protein [Lacihabitans sp. LS3-19]MCP9770246.1 single-stranded DNA-binding protein [Lacihabitans sp. LS3-19]
MKGLNKVTLIGNLGKDPELRKLEGDIAVVKLTLATTEGYKDEKGQTHTHTEWHNVVLWRGLAEMAEKYLKKGSMVCIEGKLRTRSYEDKNKEKRFVTEVIGDNVIMLDKKEST